MLYGTYWKTHFIQKYFHWNLRINVRETIPEVGEINSQQSNTLLLLGTSKDNGDTSTIAALENFWLISSVGFYCNEFNEMFTCGKIQETSSIHAAW